MRILVKGASWVLGGIHSIRQKIYQKWAEFFKNQKWKMDFKKLIEGDADGFPISMILLMSQLNFKITVSCFKIYCQNNGNKSISDKNLSRK